ncbi:MAG: hypothetical protein GY835_19620, partial [bacterium]|nr:hypothetical protein [bacterium]
MRPSVRQILLLTGTTLAMVASCTPPNAWGQSFGQVERVVEVLAGDELNGDGRGTQPPAGDGGASPWRLGTVSWGSADPVASATQAPEVVWGQFGLGWRGSDGDPRDGVKMGRVVGG